MLGDPLTVRLTPEKHALYEAAAAHSGKPLSTYLRERLEEADKVAEELFALRRSVAGLHNKIEDLAEIAPSVEAAREDVSSPQVEALMLLRAIAGTERIKVVHGELRRLGLPIWTLDEEPRG